MRQVPTLMTRSALAVRIRSRPPSCSLYTATAVTLAQCPSSSRTSVPPSASHSLTELSAQPQLRVVTEELEQW
jgi:hypothetical protein